MREINIKVKVKDAVKVENKEVLKSLEGIEDTFPNLKMEYAPEIEYEIEIKDNE